YSSDGLSGAPWNSMSNLPELTSARASELEFVADGSSFSEIGKIGRSMTPGPTALSRRAKSCIVQDVCSGVFGAGSNISLSRMSERMMWVLAPHWTRIGKLARTEPLALRKRLYDSRHRVVGTSGRHACALSCELLVKS